MAGRSWPGSNSGSPIPAAVSVSSIGLSRGQKIGGGRRYPAADAGTAEVLRKIASRPLISSHNPADPCNACWIGSSAISPKEGPSRLTKSSTTSDFLLAYRCLPPEIKRRALPCIAFGGRVGRKPTGEQTSRRRLRSLDSIAALHARQALEVGQASACRRAISRHSRPQCSAEFAPVPIFYFPSRLSRSQTSWGTRKTISLPRLVSSRTPRCARSRRSVRAV